MRNTWAYLGLSRGPVRLISDIDCYVYIKLIIFRFILEFTIYHHIDYTDMSDDWLSLIAGTGEGNYEASLFTWVFTNVFHLFLRYFPSWQVVESIEKIVADVPGGVWPGRYKNILSSDYQHQDVLTSHLPLTAALLPHPDSHHSSPLLVQLFCYVSS